jgi:hypothetical protein
MAAAQHAEQFRQAIRGVLRKDCHLQRRPARNALSSLAVASRHGIGLETSDVLAAR